MTYWPRRRIGAWSSAARWYKTELIKQIVVAKQRFSAKLPSVKQKCPNRRHKCPTFFRALCPRFVFFHAHSGFERIFLTSFFVRLPEMGHGGGDSGLRHRALGRRRGGHFVRVDIQQTGFAHARHTALSFLISHPLLRAGLSWRTTTFVFMNIVATSI